MFKRKARKVVEESSDRAMQYKAAGNDLVRVGEYGRAVQQYSQGLLEHPRGDLQASLWTNRALCYLKQSQFREAKDDCLSVLQFQSENVKARFRLGTAEYGLGEFEAGDESIRKAAQIARTVDSQLMREIVYSYRKSKRDRWQVQKEERLRREGGLQSFVLDSLSRDGQNRVSLLRQQGASEEAIGDLKSLYVVRKSELEAVFAEDISRLKSTEVPDYFTCPISCLLMRDPCITPSGISYDRAAIVAHLSRPNNKFDPVTRRPLAEHELVTNFALKSAIMDFLEANPWAADDWLDS